MKLVIREFLASLKERKELDAILPDLLLSMDLRPTVRPQTGVRQHGVDIVAHGKDPDDRQEKVFLFVVKSGDIDRRGWNEPDQGVKDSLDEAHATYAQTMLPDELSDLPVKIVICCGGGVGTELRRDMERLSKE